MASVGKFYVELVPGPSFKALLELHELLDRMFDLIPDWHVHEKAEIRAKLEDIGSRIKLDTRSVKDQ